METCLNCYEIISHCANRHGTYNLESCFSYIFQESILRLYGIWWLVCCIFFMMQDSVGLKS